MEQDTFFQTASFEDVLDDLSCRFIVNIPSEELVSVSRICFQIEQAHWFYEDFIREQNPQLPSLSLRRFSKCIFDHCPLLWQFSGRHEEEFEDFLRYKQRVPVLGGILLDENWDKCILVKAWKGGSWSFPRGKINKDEPDADCAIREVWEETGYDVSSLLLPDAFLELQIKEQRVKLYIVPGVPTDTLMSPQTRKEISMIGWIRLVDLPGYSKRNKQVNPGIKLYMVTPFMSGLRKWISQNRHRKGKLVPVDEDGAEESAVEQVETEEVGTTDDLIAMLRRPQQPLMENEQSVDLLGMLRNGTVTDENTEAPYPYPQHYLGLQNNFPTMLEQSQSSHNQQQPLSPVKASTTQGPFDSVRRNSLLSILKGGGSQFTPSEDKTTTTSLLDILKGPRSPPISSNDNSMHRPAGIDPAKAEHQMNLLSALKSPTLPAAEPTVPRTSPATVHQNALLAVLKSPTIPQSIPPTSHQSSLLSALKSPTIPFAQPNPTSTYQNSLLAALKSPPQPRSMPAAPQPSAPSSHQSSLWSALKSPSPEVPKSAPVSTHQNALLSALKSPPASKIMPPPTPQAVETLTDDHPKPASVHQNALLSALKSPPAAKATPAPTPAPLPSAIESTSASVHKNALLSALTSPKLAQTTPPSVPQKDLTTEASQQPVSIHQNALSALKSPLSQMTYYPPDTTAAKEVRPSSSSVHQNALLEALKSPPAGVMAAAAEPDVKRPTDVPAHKNALLAALTTPKPESSSTASPAPSNHTISLLDRIKNSPQKSTPSPVIGTAATPTLDVNEADPAEEVPRITSPPIPTLAPTPSHQNALLSAFKSPPTTHSVSPAPKSEQPSSLLDALRGSIPGVATGSGLKEDVKEEREVRNVHVESLLERLKSPTLEKSLPPVSTASSAPVTNGRGENSNPVTTRVVPTPKDGGRQSKLPQPQRRQSPQRRQTPTTSALSDTLKPSKPKTPTPPSSTTPIPAVAAHQKSLLSLLNPTKLTTTSAQNTTATITETAATTNNTDKEQPQQFNFSQSPQIGKRHTFKQVLTPSGVSDVDHKKSNGTTIDLGKMTLLKRPAQPEATTNPAAEATRSAPPALVPAVTATVQEPSTPNVREAGAKGEEVTSPQSPMGIEFPFKRRNTPSRSVSGMSGNTTPSPTAQKEKEKSKGNVQSLLSLLKGGPSKSKATSTAVDREAPQREPTTEAADKISDLKSEEAAKPKGDNRINSLLRVFQKTHPNAQPTASAVEVPVVEPPPTQNGSEKGLGNQRERKLVAMLERALSKGVPTSPS